jgi:hypothetical protein
VPDGDSSLDIGTITLNRLPSLSAIHYSPDRPVPGQIVTLTTALTDPDSLASGVKWQRLSPNGFWANVGNGIQRQLVMPQSKLPLTVRAVVSSQSFDIRMYETIYPANLPPEMTALTASTVAVGPGETVLLDVEAFDHDGDTLTYLWSVEGGTWRTETNEPSIEWQAPLSESDRTYRLVVRATDGALHDTARISIDVTGTGSLSVDDRAISSADVFALEGLWLNANQLQMAPVATPNAFSKVDLNTVAVAG